MPYIRKDERKKLDELFDEQGLDYFTPNTEGGLNYVITKIIHNYLRTFGMSYSKINSCIGVLECAKLELYRMVAVPYENQKHSENGAISELDKDA